VAQLECSLFRRALAPARDAALIIARLLRRDIKQGPVAPDRVSRGRVLVIDHRWPQPDRDAGSVEIFNLMQALESLGFDAILAASEQHNGPQPDRDKLTAQGIRCLSPDDAPSVAQYIIQHPLALDLCVLCRVFCGGEFLELVRAHCRQARLVFNSIDLNFVREERRAKLTGDAALLAMINALQAREEHVIRNCDATLVVSEAEAVLLADTMPRSLVAHMPLARAIHLPVAPFAARRGIGFVGSFMHAPNVDAMRWFLAEIWPLVRRNLPECTMTVVGSGAPADLVDGADGSVHLLGYLPDLGPWFESLRLTVAPLRFGAGAKGKVASSLAAGVPCIATPMAAEGMALSDNDGVLVAADPENFAATIVSAYGDATQWDHLSAGALAYAERSLSLSAWQGRLNAVLQRIGF
jgi:glycosyltransferase involved in cell wall biosynthesis